MNTYTPSVTEVKLRIQLKDLLKQELILMKKKKRIIEELNRLEEGE